MKPLKLAFANIVKQKTKKLDGSFTINLITDSELDTSSISVEELAQEISQTKNTMPVLINSEEAFKLWADAIKLLSK